MILMYARNPNFIVVKDVQLTAVTDDGLSTITFFEGEAIRLGRNSDMVVVGSEGYGATPIQLIAEVGNKLLQHVQSAKFSPVADDAADNEVPFEVVLEESAVSVSDKMSSLPLVESSANNFIKGTRIALVQGEAT